eukprot:m.226333 g.226333  ORF g.226333 m.226333 type:complete len:50 (+) comp18795_c0_seq6:2649-2798(+)
MVLAGNRKQTNKQRDTEAAGIVLEPVGAATQHTALQALSRFLFQKLELS